MAEKKVEIAWFAPLCNGDDDLLGNRNDLYKSTWENTSRIAALADKRGYRNILCPSSYQVGQDTLSFVSAMAPLTEQINFLAAVRCGEVHPPMLARAIATLDHILKGRLTINIISSDLPGTQLASEQRYAKSREVIQILKQSWTQEHLSFKGDFYQLELDTAPVKPYQQNGGPLLYFGGYSDAGVELCAEFCDVYLMWPDQEEGLKKQIEKLRRRSQVYKRNIRFGLRIHVIVRETEEEAIDYSRKLLSKLDLDEGAKIRDRALDSKSYGVAKQKELREKSSSDYFVEDHLWTGIGLARSGCGAALVGNPDQVYEKLKGYIEMGFDAFILSGYPHYDECDLFAKYVLPRFQTCALNEEMNRKPKVLPQTPLGSAKRL